MNIIKFVEKIYTSFEAFGYARAAAELQRMSDTQLLSLGLSRQKIQQGRAGLPWTIDTLIIKPSSKQTSQAASNQANFSHKAA
ncbi:DUF1127 domain-containing protein [uncultured Thiothrix sp.]|uniref:DUF1127 domain-containing protein n=1 Tax=uncultured Thiothrix sp. TaxID=223185 RepID=UPI0026106AE7|nr:DUF1127 domain-containing protein [uncultured Thiothrix sp.]